NLGYPSVHPIFHDFTQIAEVHSIAPPATTDALEFEDGKIMVGKTQSLGDVNWPNIVERYGRDKFTAKFSNCSLVGFVNWTMITYMSDIWETVLKEICPTLSGPRRKIFFDLADPEKRTADDIRRALNIIVKFEQWFDVILGLNEKEAGEIGRVLGLNTSDTSREGLCKL